MYKLIIASCDEEVEILSINSLKELLETSTFGNRYIPSLKIKENGNPKARLKVELSNKFNLKGRFPYLKYEGENPVDILVLAEYMLERLRQENHKYSIHSSSVEKNGQGIIFFGWKDSGKTSLSLKLTLEYSFNFLSEGKTVIDKDFNVVGYIHRLESKKEFIKGKFKLEDDLNNLPLSKGAVVKLFIYPQITFEKLKIENWNNEIGDFHLYEHFSWKIRSANARIHDFSYPLHSLDTQKIALERSIFIKNLINKIEVSHIRGKPKDICDLLEKTIFV